MSGNIFYEHLAFAGAETKTVAPSSANHGIAVMQIVMLSAAARAIDVKVGTTQIMKGTVSNFPAIIPVNAEYGFGGDAGDSLTFQSDGAAEAFVTYREAKFE